MWGISSIECYDGDFLDVFFMTTISSSCHFQREICGLHTWTKHYLTRVEIWCDNQKFLSQPWFVRVCVWCNKLRTAVWLTCIWQEIDVRRQIFRLASSGMTLFVYMLRPLCLLVLIIFKSHGSKLHNYYLDECYSWNLFETQFSLRPSIFSATSEYNCPRPVNFFFGPGCKHLCLLCPPDPWNLPEIYSVNVVLFGIKDL